MASPFTIVDDNEQAITEDNPLSVSIPNGVTASIDAPVSIAGTVSTVDTPKGSSSGLNNSIPSTTGNSLLIVANADRAGATVFNDSTAALYINLGDGNASSTNYTYKCPAGGYYELPFGFKGDVKGAWATNNGAARVTEFR